VLLSSKEAGQHVERLSHLEMVGTYDLLSDVQGSLQEKVGLLVRTLIGESQITSRSMLYAARKLLFRYIWRFI